MTDSEAIPRGPVRSTRRPDLDALPAASLVAVPVRKPRAASAPLPPANAAAGPAEPESAGRADPQITAEAAGGPEAAARSETERLDAAPAPGNPATLLAWWQRLKRGSGLPSPSDFDPAEIAGAWPGSVLLVCDPATQGIARASRIGGAEPRGIDYTPMVTEWLLGLGRKAARGGTPLHETRRFPIDRGVVAAYSIVALPLATDRRSVDHVLCHIGPA